MKLTKGIKPIKLIIPKELKNEHYIHNYINNYHEIITENQKLITYLKTQGYKTT